MEVYPLSSHIIQFYIMKMCEFVTKAETPRERESKYLTVCRRHPDLRKYASNLSWHIGQVIALFLNVRPFELIVGFDECGPH